MAHAIGLLALTCAAGMALGSIKFKGIGLGSAGVLFMGILVARFSEPSGLSVAAGRLFIADTNNHALRAASLATGEVRTLALSGV